MRVERRINIVLGEDDGAVLILYLCALYDICQQTIGVGCTNATAYCAVLAEGVGYAVTDHAVFAFLAFLSN